MEGRYSLNVEEWNAQRAVQLIMWCEAHQMRFLRFDHKRNVVIVSGTEEYVKQLRDHF